MKRVLKVPGYLRYVDDLVLFGDDQAEVARWRDAVVNWLATERHLRLKSPYARPRSTRGTLHALGRRITRDGIFPLERSWPAFRGAVRAALYAERDDSCGRPRDLRATMASRITHLLFP